GDRTRAFDFDFESARGDHIVTGRCRTTIPAETNAHIRLSFEHCITRGYTVPYVRGAWTLRGHNAVDDTYTWVTFDGNGNITQSNSEKINEIYATEFDRWVTHDILTELPGVNLDYFELAFYFHDHTGRDFADVAALKAFNPSTIPNPVGARRMMAGTGETYVYTLEYSADADDPPKVVRPNSYGSHGLLWRLDKVYNLGPAANIVKRIKFDNVKIAFYPIIYQPVTTTIDPPETISYTKE